MNTVFLDACRGRRTPYTPVWLMRQAGRYLPEYRALRLENRMLALCQDPALAAEVTLQPLKRFPLDAAILFSDITVPFLGMGVPFDLVPGTGPVLEAPLKSRAAIEALPQSGVAEKLPYVSETIRILKRELTVPLIGFGGAPFTLATYLVEGKPSRDFKSVRKMIYAEPDLWRTLMERLTAIVIECLSEQAKAGVDAIQVFDSWVGVLPAATYREVIYPYMRQIFQALASFDIPLIHFGVGTGHLLPLLRSAGGHVIGVDSTVNLRTVRENELSEVSIQGNLDPAALFAPAEKIEHEAARVLDEAGEKPGHIFNLGHGVLPETPIESVARLVDFVHERTRR